MLLEGGPWIWPSRESALPVLRVAAGSLRDARRAPQAHLLAFPGLDTTLFAVAIANTCYIALAIGVLAFVHAERCPLGLAGSGKFCSQGSEPGLRYGTLAGG